MKSEKLYDAINEIDEKFIDEAEKIKVQKKKIWKTIGAIAACGVFATGLFIAGRVAFPGASAGAGKYNEPGESYMSYAGPAFPLTALKNTDGIELERNIEFDFSPYNYRSESYENYNGETVWYETYDNYAVVKDNYTVTNITDSDITFTAVYPFAGNINTLLENVPDITVNGNSVDTELKIGPYSGGFAPALGDENGESKSLNLSSLESWGEYKALLENGEYQKQAFDENPKLDQKVKVYSFDITYNIEMDEFDELENPDMEIQFDCDRENTNFLMYGFEGYEYNSEEKWVKLSAAVPKSFNPDYGNKKSYIIVIGGDIDNINIRCEEGFITKYDDDKNETDAFDVSYETYETTLGDVIYNIVKTEDNDDFYKYEESESIRNIISDEDFVGLVAEFMYAHGQFSDTPAERYDHSRLDDLISEVGYVSRVMYLTFEVTVPAGESIEISTRTLREASFDFYGATDDSDTRGFDMVTKLGTNLHITKQTAAIVNTDEIELVYNNFGFDIENGITNVILGDEEHYWLEIIKREKE